MNRRRLNHSEVSNIRFDGVYLHGEPLLENSVGKNLHPNDSMYYYFYRFFADGKVYISGFYGHEPTTLEAKTITLKKLGTNDNPFNEECYGVYYVRNGKLYLEKYIGRYNGYVSFEGSINDKYLEFPVPNATQYRGRSYPPPNEFYFKAF